MTIKNKKHNNISNDLAKTPLFFDNQKMNKNNHSRNIKNNSNSNFFMKSNLTQKGYYKKYI